MKEDKEKEIKVEGESAEEQKAPATENKENKEGSDKKEQAADKKEAAEEPSADDKLAEANKTIADLKDKYLRSVAEFDNYRKRTLKEKAELILNGSEKTVVAILPILDDLERALKDEGKDAETLKEGVKNIYKKFVHTLEGLGVKKIDAANKDFDTDFHEAVAMVPGQPDDKKGKVIDCVQTGYTLNDKVIRHAKVAVGQ